MNEGGQKVQLQPQLSSGTSRARGAHAGGGSVAKPCPALATPRPVAGQAPLTVGFSRQRALECVAIPFSAKQGFMASTPAGREGAQRDRDS